MFGETIRKIIRLPGMWRRARKYGFPLRRSKGWKLPLSVKMGDRTVPIRSPDDAGVMHAFRDIFLHDCYGLEKAPRPVRTVLDLGANMGFFSICARDAFPGAQIHAYEPNPAATEYLRFHAQSVGFTCFQEAVGAHAGSIQMEMHGNSLVFGVTHRSADGNIPVAEFSTCVERLGGQVDFVKMDVEGAEWEIFQDASSWRNVRFLAMEYHLRDGHTLDECRAILRRMGFCFLKPNLREPLCQLIWAERR